MQETVRTKWLQFEREVMSPRRKTPIYYVYNHDGEYLGKISWHAPWRQYCFIVEHDHYEPMKLVLAKSCLDDITEMISKLMAERDG